MSSFAKELHHRVREFDFDTQTGAEIAVNLAFNRSRLGAKTVSSMASDTSEAYLKVKQQNRKLKQELEEIKAGLALLERQKKEASSKRFALDSSDLAQDDHKLKQAYAVISRAKDELYRLRIEVEQSKRYDLEQLENEVAYLKKQLEAIQGENSTISRTSQLQTNALEGIRLSQTYESKAEVLRNELLKERSRYSELRPKAKQAEEASKQMQDKFAELDVKVRTLQKALEENAPPQAEVRLAEASKQKGIIEKAVKTLSVTSDRAISEAEERLRAVIWETNKNSAILSERNQQVKLKDLKIKELQAKLQLLQPRSEIYGRPEVRPGQVADFVRNLNPQKPKGPTTVSSGSGPDTQFFATELTSCEQWL